LRRQNGLQGANSARYNDVMDLRVNDQIRLTEFRPTDRPALVEHLNEREIYERTLRLPYPYTEAEADAWLALAAETTREHGQPVAWAVRTAADALIGGCGLHDLQAAAPHRGEIGYWLAKPYWGRGITTAVVRRLCAHAFDAFKLVKLTAHVFDGNVASARVLQKCGFQQEGFLRKHYLKDGKFLDVRLYALLR
jgi:RimJ/RimL family protein N-acetyltransferase